MGVSLIKRRGAWEKHPSNCGASWDCRIKCIPKIEPVWTRFWQRAGQLDYLVQKLRECPGTWKTLCLCRGTQWRKGPQDSCQPAWQAGARCEGRVQVSPLFHNVERLQVTGDLCLLPPWIPNRVWWHLCGFTYFPGAAGWTGTSWRSSGHCCLEGGELPLTVEKS